MVLEPATTSVEPWASVLRLTTCAAAPVPSVTGAESARVCEPTTSAVLGDCAAVAGTGAMTTEACLLTAIKVAKGIVLDPAATAV